MGLVGLLGLSASVEPGFGGFKDLQVLGLTVWGLDLKAQEENGGGGGGA